MEFSDFHIVIYSYNPQWQGWAVTVRSSAGEAYNLMRFPAPMQQRMTQHLGNFRDTLENLREEETHRINPSQDEQIVQDLGKLLFQALIGGDIYGLYLLSKQSAADKGHILRLVLHTTNVPELMTLPWELLYDPHTHASEYLCLTRNVSFVRYMELAQTVPTLEVRGPLHILVVGANPQEASKLNIAQELRLIKNALKPLEAQKLVQVAWLGEHTTLRQLATAMERGPWHIVHFICHGGFDATKDEGFITLESGEGGRDHVFARDLALLFNGRAPQLVLLNTCEGGLGGMRDVFSSIASVLAKCGIPAILAMQYGITDKAAVEFADTFYHELAKGVPIDVVVTEARLSLKLHHRTVPEWGTPVLYLRALNSELFKLPPASSIRVKLARTFLYQVSITWPRPWKVMPVLWSVILILVVLFGSIATPLVTHWLFPSDASPCSLAVASSLPSGGGFIKKSDSQSQDSSVGLSDGSKIFDVHRDNQKEVQLKLKAAEALNISDMGSAGALLRSANDADSTDAESQIYQADQAILSDRNPYFTIVVGVAFASGNDGEMRDILQGALLAQQMCNGSASSTSPHCFLLIANAGSSPIFTKRVVQEIVQNVKQFSIVGVMGWPLSSYALDANSSLAAAGIPMVSPTASSDLLTSHSLFLRVVPSDKMQVQTAANYLQKLHKTKGVVLYNPANPYSVSLKDDVLSAFQGVSLRSKDYTGQTPEQLLTDLRADTPEFIYFCGYVSDITPLLAVWPTSGALAATQIIGADAFSVVSNYPNPGLIPGSSRLSFTAFAFYQEWQKLAPTMQQPSFFGNYQQTFDPHHTSSMIGSALPDGDAMLSYDAMQVVLQGVQNVFSRGQTDITPNDLWSALQHLPVIQGVTGAIQFGTDGNPMNKEVLLLSVDSHGVPQMVGSNGGCFIKGQC